MNFSPHISRRLVPGLFAIGLLALPAVVSAHPGHYHPGEGDEFAASFMAGIRHPITGLDHLLAAIAVGWVCAALGKARGFTAAKAFLITLIAGGVAGRFGFVIPGLEAALAISLITLGLFIASLRPARSAWMLPLLLAIAVVHGSAHGSEGPQGLTALVFGSGFVLCTAALVGCGSGLRLLIDRSRPLHRLAGSALAAVGAFFLWQAV